MAKNNFKDCLHWFMMDQHVLVWSSSEETPVKDPGAGGPVGVNVAPVGELMLSQTISTRVSQ